MYKFKINIKKYNLSLELSSENKQLILDEFNKFAASLNFDNTCDIISVDNISDDTANFNDDNQNDDVDPVATSDDILPDDMIKNENDTESDILEDVISENTIDEQNDDEIILPDNLQDTLSSDDIITNEEDASVEYIEEVEAEEKTEKKSIFPANFASILKEKSSEELNVIEKKDSELKNTYLQMNNIMNEKNIISEIDYIIVAAYCITHYEAQQRFTEDNIKAKVAPFMDEDLDHRYILDAIDKDYIRVLPDFTGVSDELEFELTPLGEEYFINEL